MTLRAASTALLALSLVTAAAGALAATLTGSGRGVTEDRAAAGCTGIALAIPGRVEVVQGATEGIPITADDNVLPEIESVVEGGTLKLRFRQRFHSVKNARAKISVAGSGDIRYYGDTTIEKSILGSGSVRRLGAAPA